MGYDEKEDIFCVVLPYYVGHTFYYSIDVVSSPRIEGEFLRIIASVRGGIGVLDASIRIEVIVKVDSVNIVF